MALDETPGYLPILEKLIAFPSVSSNSNLDCIDYIEDFLIRHEFQTQRFYNSAENKANLIARIGPERSGGLMLAGHSDVVPVTGQNWHSDPFQLLQSDQCLYGRGTADMKGFLALALCVAAEIDTAKLERPLYLAFTYDEEIGCHGAKALVQTLRELPAKPAFVLIGEPTDSALVSAHKGVRLMQTRLTGKAAHSSRPDLGASTIVFASKLIAHLEELLPHEQDPAFEPPGSTFNVGLIRGGAAVNIIPEHCEFQWEVRSLPNQDANAVEQGLPGLVRNLSSSVPGVTVEHQVLSEVPGLRAGQNDHAIARLAELMEQPAITTAPFVTEGGIYQQAGIPAVICGPGRVEEAHQPDESVNRAALERFRLFLKKLVKTLENAE